jgi:negative regulator of sigma-B (phosphoserine phosphatase)
MNVAYASLPMVGETANGDRPLVRRDDEHRTMLAVIDGLGHGPLAAAVADIAVECLGAVSLGAPLLEIMELLHGKLAGSRGAAATVCLVRDGQVEACAVGNVELRTSETRLPLIFSAGILGKQLRRFHICQAKLVPRSRLVLFSDGISSRTPFDEMRKLAAGPACDAIIAKYRRKEDDATVMVADVGEANG